MAGVNRVWVLLAFLLAGLGGCAQVAAAQGPTTTVQDVVYTATGVPASGSVVVSWGAFTTAGGVSIPAGSTSVTLGAGGALSIALAPNAGGTPMGSYYTAVFHLSDGSTSREFWVVPVTVPGGGPAKLAAIQNSVLPTTVAMQTVSKAYVDNAIAAAQISPIPMDASPYVLKAGDTMTGPLVLPADPVSPNQAADKHYVDVNVAAATGGFGEVVHTLPTVSQVVAQPSGTQLGVNLLNGELYASQYQTGSGGNGIANATASADCGSGCKLEIEPTYGSEPVTLGAWPNGIVVEDQRGGADTQTAVNPMPTNTTLSSTRSVTQNHTMSQQQLNALRPGTPAIGAATESLTMNALTGGTNLYPAELETPPNFKSTFGVLDLNGVYNTQGQHIQLSSNIRCYGVGDCLAGGQFIYSSGGYRDDSDEGAHPYDLQVMEDSSVFQGTCLTNCTTGSTSVTVSQTGGGGSQGDGRFLADMAPAKTISAGTIVGGGQTIFATAQFSGTSFPVSVFLSFAATVTSQANNVAPGTVTVAIATGGVTAGFATNTAALPATSGIACIADLDFPNYEMAPYTVVDGTHLQMTLNKPHKAGAAIAVGGLCGYGLNQTVDDVGAIKQVFPVIGSTDATDLYYAGALTGIVGKSGSTSGYLNVSLPIATAVRSANVVTVTLAGYLPEDVNGLTLTVSGVADASYNGSYVVSTTGQQTLTYANAGPDSTSTGGTVGMLTGGYNLYPIAEVLSVFNPATHAVDGTFTLAPNTVAWAAGDPVEEPHYYQQNTSADTELISQYLPRPNQFVGAGKIYEGNVTRGLRGWQITNGQPASYYLGAGGTHDVPDEAYQVAGYWGTDFEVTAGTQAVIYAHCNLMGCGRWDSAYNLFLLDSATGIDRELYDPSSSTLTWLMGRVGYSFSPTAFTAGTINVGTLNATTITGGVSGGAITSGTVSAARLPVFGPSGTSHAAGIVPDPGATAGAARYLREDGTWDVPAGGSGGGAGAAGGDLAGSYPNPTVAAVHATSGTLDGVTIGATAPGAGTFTSSTITGGSTSFGELTLQAGATNLGYVGTYTDYAALVANRNPANGVYADPTKAFAAIAVHGQTSNGWVEINTSNQNGTLTGDNTFTFDAGGSFTSPGAVKAASYLGPAAAPTGSCATVGAWVFSQDGHATFCAGGTWVTKL